MVARHAAATPEEEINGTKKEGEKKKELVTREDGGLC